jgi:hydroxyethylthiazole kinase-like sugar kinase family protein
VWTDGLSAVEVSHQLWANLKTIAVASGAIDLVSDELADRLIAV